jgi:small Trp-rich protein
MYFVALGLILFVMKVAELGPVAEWGWLAVLWPFAAAVLWWAYADKVGLTQKRAMNKMEERKTERRRKHLVALGINPRDRENADRVKRQAEAQKSSEAKRDK